METVSCSCSNIRWQCFKHVLQPLETHTQTYLYRQLRRTDWKLEGIYFVIFLSYCYCWCL